MKLNIAESFLILAHHPEKPRFIADGNIRNAGLIGGIFLDLSLKENIVIEDNLIIVKSAMTRLSQGHKDILDKMIDAPKKRKPKAWISRFTQRASKPKWLILEGLDNKAIMEIENKSFLFFPYRITRLVKPKIREELIRELREIIFGDKEADSHSASILGLIQACKLYSLVCNDKAEQKKSKSKIKEIVESNVFTKGVATVIQEMQAAVMAAVIASTAASTAVVASSGS